MKRLFPLVMLILMIAGCAAGKGSHSGQPNREAVLPDGYISRIAGTPMKLAYSTSDERAGVVRWAWEETGGLPRLLSVEVHFPPADCDSLYNQAKAGTPKDSFIAPEGADVFCDGRATHIRFGIYYVKIVTLGFPEEKDALELIAARLASKMAAQ